MSSYDFSNIGAKWEDKDEQKLLCMYTKEKKNIVDISQELKRTPTGVTSRLCKLNLIENSYDCKGFSAYLTNPEYADYKNAVTEEKKKKTYYA